VTVVDFWAEWCARASYWPQSSRSLRETTPRLASESSTPMRTPEIASRYGVMSLPTVLLFKDGEPVDAIIGAVPREMIETRLKVILNE